MHSLNIKLNEMEAGIREIAFITKSFPSSLSLQCRIMLENDYLVHHPSSKTVVIEAVTYQPQLLLFVFEQFVQRGEQEVRKLLSLQVVRLASCQLLQQDLHLTPALDKVQLGGGELLPEEPEQHTSLEISQYY